MLMQLLERLSTLHKSMFLLQNRVFSSIKTRNESNEGNTVNSSVKQFSLYLSEEFEKMSSSSNLSRRDTLKMLVKRWKRLRESDKDLYSGFEITVQSKKSKFPKTTKIINVRKNKDLYSMVSEDTTQSLNDQSDDVIRPTENNTPQKLSHVNGFSVFMHQQYRILSKRQPNTPSRKIFSKVATLWRDSNKDTRNLYKKYADRIRVRYNYTICGVINFDELFEEVVATTKSSGKILEEQVESDDYDYTGN